jgi:butanol dehydrogenase
MLDFTYMVPTKVLFGRNTIERLAEELTPYGKKILFVYGGGSIKKTGIYDTVTKILMRNSLTHYELPGVVPNPWISMVRQGIKLCNDHYIDCIVAVGGGSVIDTAKTIAAGFYYDGDPWDMFLLGDSSIQNALPVGTVLTVAGSGSEMNGNAVITNEETQQKRAIHHDILRPRFSILDPTYTFTVPPRHTAAGTVDMFSHILEQYFSPTTDAFVQDRLAESLLLTCITYGPLVLKQPTNYEARAQLMWTSSLALNGLLGYGRITDWATHAIEHTISAVYDITHGAGLAIIIPHWMEYVLSDETAHKFVEYARNVWEIKGYDDRVVAKKGIEKTRGFFTSLGMPKTLREVGVTEQKLKQLAEQTVKGKEIGKFRKLEKSDVLTILKNAL